MMLGLGLFLLVSVIFLPFCLNMFKQNMLLMFLLVFMILITALVIESYSGLAGGLFTVAVSLLVTVLVLPLTSERINLSNHNLIYFLY